MDKILFIVKNQKRSIPPNYYSWKITDIISANKINFLHHLMNFCVLILIKLLKHQYCHESSDFNSGFCPNCCRRF